MNILIEESPEYNPADLIRLAQQEAEFILASPGDDVEATREAREVLEAIYSNNLQDSTSTSASEADTNALALWWKVSAAEAEKKFYLDY